MFASVTGISIAVLAVVTPPTVANVRPSPLPPPPQRPPGALNNAGGGAINILVIAVLATIVGLLCCLAMVCRWTRRRQVELRRKDVNHGLRSMSVRRVSVNPLHQHQAHAGGSVRVIDSPPPPLGGGGGGGGGIEMSGRFDHHSSETEGSSRADGAEGGARPAMAGVIGASDRNTIRRTRTMAERSRMQDMPDMVSQQKDEGDAAMMSARDASPPPQRL
jgi:hypothetical protein